MNSASAASVDAATPTGDENGSTRVVEQHEPDEDPDEQPGEERVGERARDHPVDVVEPVLRDPDPDPERDAEQPDDRDAADDPEHAGVARAARR